MSEDNTTNNAGGGKPGFLKALCILSFIGSGAWALLSLIGIFASGWVMSLMGGAMDSAMADMEGMDGFDAEASAEAAEAVGMLGSIGGSIIVVLMIGSLVLAMMSLMGVSKMYKLQKSGFVWYTIANAILALLTITSVIWPLICIGFIIMYGVNRKHMS